MPFVRRTRATFRSAEFGFFGVEVKTRTQTPRFWGHAPSGFLPIVNHGELAILFCWLFLYIAAQGPGAYALDGLRDGYSTRRQPKEAASQPRTG